MKKRKITIERIKRLGVNVLKINGEILEGATNVKINYSYGQNPEDIKEVVEVTFKNFEIEIIDID